MELTGAGSDMALQRALRLEATLPHLRQKKHGDETSSANSSDRWVKCFGFQSHKVFIRVILRPNLNKARKIIDVSWNWFL